MYVFTLISFYILYYFQFLNSTNITFYEPYKQQQQIHSLKMYYSYWFSVMTLSTPSKNLSKFALLSPPFLNWSRSDALILVPKNKIKKLYNVSIYWVCWKAVIIENTLKEKWTNKNYLYDSYNVLQCSVHNSILTVIQPRKEFFFF